MEVNLDWKVNFMFVLVPARILTTGKHSYNPCNDSVQALVTIQLLTSMKANAGQLSSFLHPLNMGLTASSFCKYYFSYIKKSLIISYMPGRVPGTL